MTKEELLKFGLNEEQIGQILNGLIPKDRFDEVNNAKKKALETIAERDQQLEDLKKSKLSIDDLKAEITKLQDANKQAQLDYETQLNTLKLDNAIDRALLSVGAKNTKCVKALLDMNSIKFENDVLSGLDEQLNNLKSTDAFLFDAKNNTSIVGMKQLDIDNTNTNSTPNSYSEWCNFLNNK